MNNLALYRKYRPKEFKDVVGQDHIVSVLENSIKNDKVSHAYLFVGTRGTGKTSVARIFAHDIEVTPNDLYEIDAASNRGIENIKELRDGVRVLPFDSKYKIYIIDEVHMLSKDAWGALLKTLEEPPKHVIFILATTELHKVPETIISRCQVFNFKKASEVLLKKMLHEVAKKEGFKLEAGVAELLAILADGSFRDGLGVLQKVLNFSHPSPTPPQREGVKIQPLTKITKEEVEKITGTPKTVLVNNFISAIAHEDVARGIETIEKANEENLDMKLFLKLIILKFRMAVVLRYAPKLEDEMRGDLSDEDITFLNDLIKADTKGMLRSRALSILLGAYADIDNAFISGLPIELALINIVASEK